MFNQIQVKQLLKLILLAFVHKHINGRNTTILSIGTLMASHSA